MTKRLYYTDSYQTQFETTVSQVFTFEEKPSVVLEQTAFYPTGGGQPNDLGSLDKAQVIDVIVDPTTNNIIHILDRPLDSACIDNAHRVAGSLDWQRRFDLMQQHSGQHLLSQAIIQKLSLIHI